MDTLQNGIIMGGLVAAIGCLFVFFINRGRRRSSSFPPPPEVPGLPIVGNLLQLKEKKPYKTFTKWAEIYGPIYSIRAGANFMVVLSSTDVAKELSSAMMILTCNKNIVATSDYNEFYKVSKRLLLESTLGSAAQKRHYIHREALVDKICHKLHARLKAHPSEPVDFRNMFKFELFGLGLRQAMGIDKDMESIFVEELGTSLSRDQLFKILVTDPMEGAIEVDWRDFFPYLKWVPNKKFENKLQQMHSNRQAVMKAFIKKQRDRVDAGEAIDCYFDYLLSEATSLSEQQILMLLWEDIIETSDTTLVAAEWAMYELCKNPERQKHLYSEIQKICGIEKLTEDKLRRIPYLSAVFQETLRKYSPVPILPIRYAHEDTQIGGYHIPAGTEIAINIYGCNMDKNVWETPEEWKPERFAAGDSTDLHKTMAFGGGKRVCIGALQAMTVSCVAIGRFVQEFSWSLVDEQDNENVDTLGLTTHKLHPLLAVLKPRT